MQKDKYIVHEFNIKVIFNTLQNYAKFSLSGCKSGWIDLSTFTLNSWLTMFGIFLHGILVSK